MTNERAAVGGADALAEGLGPRRCRAAGVEIGGDRVDGRGSGCLREEWQGGRYYCSFRLGNSGERHGGNGVKP
jgi:hypothetical protein